MTALAELRVLDLARARAGRTAAYLADFSADLIKLGAPDDGGVESGGLGSDFQNLHCNGRSLGQSRAEIAALPAQHSV